MGAMRQCLTRTEKGNQAGKYLGARGRESDPLSPLTNLIPSPTAVQRVSELSGQESHSPLCPPNTQVKTPKGISCKLEFLMWKEMFPDIKKKINKLQHHTKEKEILRFVMLKGY